MQTGFGRVVHMHEGEGVVDAFCLGNICCDLGPRLSVVSLINGGTEHHSVFNAPRCGMREPSQ